MTKLFILLFVGTVWCDTFQEKLLYYKKLWNRKVADVNTYQRPTYNAEFNFKFLTKDPVIECYDYIVIGGGASGAVVANRLSENKANKVLLLEAGCNETEFSRIPGAYLAVQSSDFNWGYLTEPQENACQSMNNNQCNFAQGKALGGNTAIGPNIFVRGNKKEYNFWKASGNDGWDYDGVLGYFKKMERLQNFIGDPAYRGNDGPWVVSKEVNNAYSLTNVILAGHDEIGFKDIDYNAKYQISASKVQSNVRSGMRFSTNSAYLTPILKRKNLVVRTNALATKIRTVKKGNLIVGTHVEYLHNGKLRTAKADKEIIVSAGAVNSPQLLMLSGIGPKEELSKHGIPTILDLPVGKSLKDHITYFGLVINHDVEFPTYTLQQDLSEYLQGYGRMAAPIEAEISFRSRCKSKSSIPTVAITHSLPRNYNTINLIKKFTNYKEEVFTGSAPVSPNAILSDITLLNPKSSGTVTLKSANPLDFPIIDPNYLSHPSDVKDLLWGIKKVLQLLETDAFKSINATLGDNTIPACKGPQTTKDFWRCKIRNTAFGNFEAIGTCRMGTDKLDSVVDNKLKIHGTKNIRVVDASVIPFSGSGYTATMSAMIAEKISDDIILSN